MLLWKTQKQMQRAENRRDFAMRPLLPTKRLSAGSGEHSTLDTAACLNFTVSRRRKLMCNYNDGVLVITLVTALVS